MMGVAAGCEDDSGVDCFCDGESDGKRERLSGFNRRMMVLDCFADFAAVLAGVADDGVLAADIVVCESG